MSGHIWLFVWFLYGIFVETKRSFKSASFCTDSSRTSRLSIFTVYFCSLQYYYCCNKLLVFMCFFSMNNNILFQLRLGVTSPQRSFGVRLSRIHFSSIGVRAGGARGTAAPPKFGQLRFFGQHEKIWAKPVFKDVSMFFIFIIILKR